MNTEHTIGAARLNGLRPLMKETARGIYVGTPYEAGKPYLLHDLEYTDPTTGERTELKGQLVAIIYNGDFDLAHRIAAALRGGSR